jgi:hypothetical protein
MIKIGFFLFSGLFIMVTVFYLPKCSLFAKSRIEFDSAYSNFLNTEVIGVIKEVDYRNHAISIILMDDKFYLCDPLKTNNRFFKEMVKAGDSLIKHVDETHFTLKTKESKTYRFNIEDRTLTNTMYKRIQNTKEQDDRSDSTFNFPKH